jgi:hypothetical protein
MIPTRALALVALTTGLVGACSSPPAAVGGAAGADGSALDANGSAAGTDGASANGGNGVVVDSGGVVADGGGRIDGAHCLTTCPVPFVTVMVPADRLNDVASIVGTAPCDHAAATLPGESPDLFFIPILGGEGTCHLTVSFSSGAPAFAADVKVAFSNPCCPTQSTPQPGVIFVPEIGSVDGGTGGDASDDPSG